MSYERIWPRYSNYQKGTLNNYDSYAKGSNKKKEDKKHERISAEILNLWIRDHNNESKSYTFYFYSPSCFTKLLGVFSS